MGSGSSQPKDPIMDHHHQPYPDMNVIFKGIPKMMQVADDMHRMTNYMMDMRNMTVGLMCVSIVGVFLFLIMKFAQGRSSAARRRREVGRRNETDSSSPLTNCVDDRSLPRHHASHYGTYQGFPDPWQEHRTKTAIDMDKVQLAVNPAQSDGERSQETSPRLNDSRRTAHTFHNGHALKRPEPIKLLVEDLPYADT